MNEEVRNFLWGYFGPEMADREDEIRRSLRNSPAEYRETVKSGISNLLVTRSLSINEFYDLTDSHIEYADEDHLYAAIAKAYEQLFDEPAPS